MVARKLGDALGVLQRDRQLEEIAVGHHGRERIQHPQLAQRLLDRNLPA
jgi:hypothetical protein